MAEADLSVKIGQISLKNPVMTASGTFGSGMEYSEYMDLNILGALITKGVSIEPWEGNGSPRIAETPSGMLNAIGLQNPGVDVFIKRDLKFLGKYDVPVGVNICGHTQEEYVSVIRKLNFQSRVGFYEVNISCPNVKQGGIAFGTDPKMVEKITRAVKGAATKPVIMKLSPNVTSIADTAKAAEAGGADAISLINTITGMKIDIERQKFALANKTGGLSGPAIHPVAVRMVYEASHAVRIPVVGMGGISTAADAIEMMLAGATAVSIGTANFYNPTAASQIIDGMKDYLDRHNISSIRDIIGAVS